jgi:hypothetical protein
VKGYNLHTTYDGTYKDIDRQCNIAFQSGKGACGSSLHEKGNSTYYVWGKFSDMVRVYSALKRNEYELRVEVDDE